MPIKAPTSFKAGRIVSFVGVTYQPGDTIPNSVLKNMGNLSALLGRGIVVPNLPLRPGTNRAKVSTPSDINAATRKNIP